MTGGSSLRVGIVGAGANTRRHHLPNLASIEGVDVVAVANRTPASSTAVAEEWDIGTVHDDWRALVTDDGVDAVVIGTWPDMHHPVTLAALGAGKHVLCEARMAMDAAEAREMLAASVGAPDLVAQIVPSPLSFAVDATILRHVRAGYLGDPVAVDVAARADAFPELDAPLHWRQDVRRSGVNVMSLGIWYESIMRWIGPASEVVAAGRIVVPTRVDADGRDREIGVPDHLDVLATMEWGAAPARFQMSSVTGLAGANHAVLFGSEGVLRFEDGALLGGRRGADRLEPIEIPPHERGTWQVERDWVRSIREGAEVRLTDFATGVRYMEFTEAVTESMRERRFVDLPAGGRA